MSMMAAFRSEEQREKERGGREPLYSREKTFIHGHQRALDSGGFLPGRCEGGVAYGERGRGHRTFFFVSGNECDRFARCTYSTTIIHAVCVCVCVCVCVIVLHRIM